MRFSRIQIQSKFRNQHIHSERNAKVSLLIQAIELNIRREIVHLGALMFYSLLNSRSVPFHSIKLTTFKLLVELFRGRDDQCQEHAEPI